MKTDILIIGSGIAGLNFALKAAKYGKVLLVTKKEIMESNTNYAQGGVAAVMSKHDSFQSHIKDTLKTGVGLCNKKAVEVMVKAAPKEIKQLIKLGVGFSRKQGKLALGKEGGHSTKRIVHAADATGAEIEKALEFNVRANKNINVLEDHIAFELIVKNNTCLGARIIDINHNSIDDIFAKVTIIATGGVGRLYLRTSNPSIATGDGIAMAYNAGAVIEDMEFIQFHPTTLAKKESPLFLISEAVRGEGAILKVKGKLFMHKYHEMKDLAPRDIVTRAIVKESKKGQVYLDITHKESKFLKKRFPTIYKHCLKEGIDIAKHMIPVTPAAHYSCGGIKVNIDGKTTIKNLFSFGEAACTGVHGANRLASNSLLESLVFSERAVRVVKDKIKKIKLKEIRLPRIRINNKNKDEKYYRKIRVLMWNNIGIIREERKLRRTLKELRRIEKKVNKRLKKGISKYMVGLKSMITVAQLITKSALTRKESRGTHFMLNYPNTNKEWKKHIQLKA